MALTYIRAAESTGNVPSDRGVRDVSRRIKYLDPNESPFTLLAYKSGDRKATRPKIEWIEKELEGAWTQINNGAGYNTTATSLTVDDGTIFRVGDIVNVVRTAEKMRVTAQTATTITVVRAVDGDATTGVAILDNDDLQIIGNSHAEGAALGTEVSHQEVYAHNFLQIVRRPFGTTGTEANSENYTGPDRDRLRAEMAIMHKIQIERLGLFGERKEHTNDNDGSANGPRRYTGGLLFYLTTNVKDASGTLTEPEMEDFCQTVFEHTGAGTQRVLFASSLVVSVIDQLAAGRLQTVPSDKTYGIAINQWITSHGTLMIVKHRLLENGPGGTGFGGYALAVDPKNVKYAHLQNRDTKLRMNVQAPGDDKWTDEYLTECGWEIAQEKLHGVLKGVTG